MTEVKLVEEILEIASELDRGDITFDEAQIKAENIVRIDRYEQLEAINYTRCCAEFKTDKENDAFDEGYSKGWAVGISVE